MSADNGIYIAEFPNGEIRVAYASDSVIGELETHWYSPEEYREMVMEMFSGGSFTEDVEAYKEARRMELEFEDGTGFGTEYGIQHIRFSVNYGECKRV